MLKNRLPEICLAACLLGMLPLLTLQMFHLWERPHFQFFPLAWLGFAWFAWRGGGAIADTAWPWRTRFAMSIWAIGLVTCGLAMLLFSPWVAYLAALLCIFGWGLQRLGDLPWWRWVAWQALLWCALPLPGNMDAALVGKLQAISSQSASSILDVLGVLHLQQGNVLEIRSRKLFVDEACSGVDSLYALGAVSILITLFQQKPFLVSLFSILTVPLWAWLGNVLRLTTITLCIEFGGMDLSTGWKHSLLGLVIFALMAFCYFRGLEGFAHLFRRFSMASLPQTNRQWHVAYNRIVCFPAVASALHMEKDEYFDDAVLPTPIPSKAESSDSAAKSPKPRLVFPVFCIAVGLIGLPLSLFLILRNDDLQNALALPEFGQEQVAKAMGQESLPPKLLDAAQISSKLERRASESFFGEYSQTWNYQDARSPFVLSIDFPFRGFHQLWVCYTNTGHRVVAQSSVEHTIVAGNTPVKAIVHRVDLVDDAGGSSYLLFVNFDKNGAVVADESASMKDALMDRIFRSNPAYYRLQPVAFQSQLYVNTGAELPLEAKNHYESIFLEALPHMIAAVQRLNQQ